MSTCTSGFSVAPWLNCLASCCPKYCSNATFPTMPANSTAADRNGTMKMPTPVTTRMSVTIGISILVSKPIRNVVAGRRVSSSTQLCTGRGNASATRRYSSRKTPAIGHTHPTLGASGRSFRTHWTKNFRNDDYDKKISN